MRLAKSKEDKMFLGVCGGLSRKFDIDVRKLRATVVVMSLFSFGVVVVFYCALAYLMD